MTPTSEFYYVVTLNTFVVDTLEHLTYKTSYTTYNIDIRVIYDGHEYAHYVVKSESRPRD